MCYITVWLDLTMSSSGLDNVIDRLVPSALPDLTMSLIDLNQDMLKVVFLYLWSLHGYGRFKRSSSKL